MTGFHKKKAKSLELPAHILCPDSLACDAWEAERQVGWVIYLCSFILFSSFPLHLHFSHLYSSVKDVKEQGAKVDSDVKLHKTSRFIP